MSRKGLDVRKAWGRERAGTREFRRQVVRLAPVEAFATMELSGCQLGWLWVRRVVREVRRTGQSQR